MAQPLYIVGTAGLAREVAHLILMIDPGGERWRFQGFIGSREEEIGTDLVFGKVVATDESFLAGNPEAALAIGIGRPKIRAAMAEIYRSRGEGLSFPNLVAPGSTFDDRFVSIGQGNIFCGGLISCQVEIGDFNYFNWYATVGHDSCIGSCNVINPSANLSGGSRLGDRILVGTGAQLLEGVRVGDDAIVGAGAVATSDVGAGDVVVGVPAKPLRR